VDITITDTGNGSAAVTTDGTPAVLIAPDGRGGVTLTLPDTNAPGVSITRAPAPPTTSTGGLTWTDTTATVTAPGRSPITVSRSTPRTDDIAPTPADVPALVGQDQFMYALAACMVTPAEHVMIMGPTGVGKTTAVRAIAEAFGWAFVGTVITPGTTAEDLLGGLMPVPGDVVRFGRVDGPITRAIRAAEHGPVILLLDEGNRIDRVSEYTCLYPLLDGQGYVVVDGETYRLPHPENLTVVMTANPASGDYVGTRTLDPALSNRFGLKPAIQYPAADAEAAALMARVLGLSSTDADTIAEVARRVRTDPSVSLDLGFRTLHAWALQVASGRWTMAEAADLTIIAEAAEQADAIRDIIGLVLPGSGAAAA
jgi:hypothetical protein